MDHSMQMDNSIQLNNRVKTTSVAVEKKEPGLAKSTWILTLITIVAGSVLGGVHLVTAAPIAEKRLEVQEAAQLEVFADAVSFEEMAISEEVFTEALVAAGIDQTTIYSVSAALDESGETVGYVVDAGNNEGYGGEVELMVGVSLTDGIEVEGISFLNLEETAGMGMKAEDAEFKGQFTGLNLGDAAEVVYTKTGSSADNEIDAISGCTITTNAVTKAVNGAIVAAQTAEVNG